MKNKNIWIIVGVVIIAIVTLSFLTTKFFKKILYSEKTPITAETFNTIMKDNGYSLIDTTKQYVTYGDYIKKSYVAKKQDYQIEFYELSNVDNANTMFYTNKEIFEKQKGNISKQFSRSGKNYSQYFLKTNIKYSYLSRIDNTLLYINVDTKNTNEVENIINELGY